MENFSHSSSYPESGGSSPRSREIDDNAQSLDEAPPPVLQSSNYKVKLMCSYGGKIQPRPHDNQLSYVGGDTKILTVDRNAKFHVVMSKLASLCGDPDVCFKYQLPGEDLDALVSVTNDEDLEHLMIEYDRLYKASPKPARLRLFIFRLKPAGNPTGSGEVKSDQQWFVDALNCPPAALAPLPPPPTKVGGNPDFLFGLEKDINETSPEVLESEDPIASQQVKKPTEETNPNPCYYPQKVPEIPVQVSVPFQAASYPDLHVAPGGYAEQKPVYLLAASTAGVYQTQGLRPVTGQIGHQGYYGMQTVYNAVPFQASKVPQAAGFVQMGLESAGRQVYYTAAAPYQAVLAAATAAADGWQGGAGGVGALNQDGTAVAAPQASPV